MWFVLVTLLAAPSAARRPAAPSQEPVQVLPPDEARARVQTYLGSIDTPITDRDWRALGKAGADALETLVRDGNRFPTHRARALHGLSTIDPQRAVPLAGPLARDEEQPIPVRVAALHAVAAGVPRARLVHELSPVLQRAADPSLRGEAAAVLVTHVPAEGCRAVRRQAEREDEVGRAGLERALARCP